MFKLMYRSIQILFNLIELAILIRIIISFLNIRISDAFSKLIYEATEPILGPSRALIEKTGINTGMFDFSPVVAIFILRFILYIFRLFFL